MKLKFMKQHNLDTLKENILYNKESYIEDENTWIYNFFNGQNPFEDFKTEVNDFELDTSDEVPTNTDLNNIKIIYDNLNFLSESEASDERLWAGLAHETFYTYMKYRWGKQIILSDNADNKIIGKIKQSYFYGFGKRRSLAWNGIAKLWWIGKLTYDKTLKNPYEITEYAVKDLGTTTLYLLSSNFTGNDNIRFGMFKAILEYEKSGYKISRTKLKELMKMINVLGGSYLLDFYSEDEIRKKCLNMLSKIVRM